MLFTIEGEQYKLDFRYADVPSRYTPDIMHRMNRPDLAALDLSAKRRQTTAILTDLNKDLVVERSVIRHGLDKPNNEQARRAAIMKLLREIEAPRSFRVAFWDAYNNRKNHAAGAN